MGVAGRCLFAGLAFALTAALWSVGIVWIAVSFVIGQWTQLVLEMYDRGDFK